MRVNNSSIIFKLECEIIKNISFFRFTVIAFYCCSSVVIKRAFFFLYREINYDPQADQMSLLWDLALALKPTTEPRGCLISLREQKL